MSRRIRVLVCLATLCGALASGAAPAVAQDFHRAERNAVPDIAFGGRSAGGFATGAREIAGASRDRSSVGRVLSAGGSYVMTNRYRDGYRDGVRRGGRAFDRRQDNRYDARHPDFRRDRNEFRFQADRRSFASERRQKSRGSFIRLRDFGRIDRFERDPRYDSRRNLAGQSYDGTRTLTTFDVGDGGWYDGSGSFVTFGSPRGFTQEGPVTLSGSEGPKIIDIASERLDRRRIGPSGIDVVDTGGARIIRIAPGYRMAAAKTTPRADAAARDLGLQPWSSGWLAYCAKRHASFDAELGTYRSPDGRVRFCSAD